MTAAVILAIVLAVPQVPSPPPVPRTPGADQPAPKGTASIRGRVTSAGTGRPLRRAQIQVRGAALPQGRHVSTDIEGEYEITDLPSGRYTIRVTRSGHLETLYGQRRYGEPGKPLEIAEGARHDRIDFVLRPAATVTGRITDDTGEPVAGALVFAMQSQFFRGRRRLVPVAPTAHSDDTGYFRILSVPPGDYLIAATLREKWTTETEPIRTLSFAQTFFPGTSDPAAAERVKVVAGQEVSSIEFPLVPIRVATLSGTAIGSDGQPLGGASIQLVQETIGPAGGTISFPASGRVEADGSWKLRDVIPGEYRLQVNSQNPDRPSEGISMRIAVHDADMEGITLMADPGCIVSGTVTVEGGRAIPASTSTMRVSTFPVDPDRMVSRPYPAEHNGLMGDDGTFSVRSVSGHVLFEVSPLPDGWGIKSVEIAGREHVDVPFELKAAQTLAGVGIVLSSRFPSVTGKVTGDNDAPVEGVVVLFADDEARWIAGTGNMMSARADEAGTFRFSTVRPGEYLIAALESAHQWQVSDPEFLRELRDSATKVSVKEGASQSLTLKVRR